MLYLYATEWDLLQNEPASGEASRSVADLYHSVWLACTRLKARRQVAGAVSGEG